MRVEKGTGLVDRLVRPETAMIVLAIRVATAIHLPGHHVLVAIDPILRAPLVMEIRGRPVPVVTDHTPLVQRATATLGHAVRATTALAFRVVTKIRDHLGPAAETVPTVRAPRATAIPLVGRRVLVETVRIRRALRGMARVRTGLEAIVRIVRVPIGHMAISHVASGSPMGESVVRSAKR